MTPRECEPQKETIARVMHKTKVWRASFGTIKTVRDRKSLSAKPRI